MKQFEMLLAAVAWYQTETFFDPLVCWHDGTKLVGRAHLGSAFLECPHCGNRLFEIPAFVTKLYYEVHDMPTGWQLQEAQQLAEKLGRPVPESVLDSAMQLGQYIKSARGKVIELGEGHGNN